MSTILVIEDDHNLREGLCLLFEIEGYRTVGTSNGVAGIEMIRSQHPDLVLTNFQMPGADGFDVLKAIRGNPDSANMPVIFLTADHAPSVREKAVRDGANAFITKPFRIEDLTELVGRLITNHQEHEYP